VARPEKYTCLDLNQIPCSDAKASVKNWKYKIGLAYLKFTKTRS